MTKQVGKCTDDFYSDKGYFTLPNGDVYEGDYMVHRSGLLWREGFGEYCTHDGHVYKGHWQDDKLMDNTEVDIVYPTKQTYHGFLCKNMYESSGAIKFPCSSILLGNFNANKPDGPVILLDPNGNVWRGSSDPKSNKILLKPEHTFFNQIHPQRGVARDKLMHLMKPIDTFKIQEREDEENMKSSTSDTIPGGCKLRPVTSEERNDSPWYDDYVRFKEQRERILMMRRNHERMNLEDLTWYRNYIRTKERRKHKPAVKEVDTLLLEKFYSEEHRMSAQGYHVIEPSYYWLPEKISEEFDTEEVEKEEEASTLLESDATRDEEEAVVEEIESTVPEEEQKMEIFKNLQTVGVGTLSMDDFLTNIAQRIVKKSKCTIQEEKKLYRAKECFCDKE